MKAVKFFFLVIFLLSATTTYAQNRDWNAERLEAERLFEESDYVSAVFRLERFLRTAPLQYQRNHVSRLEQLLETARQRINVEDNPPVTYSQTTTATNVGRAEGVGNETKTIEVNPVISVNPVNEFNPEIHIHIDLGNRDVPPDETTLPDSGNNITPPLPTRNRQYRTIAACFLPFGIYQFTNQPRWIEAGIGVLFLAAQAGTAYFIVINEIERAHHHSEAQIHQNNPTRSQWHKSEAGTYQTNRDWWIAGAALAYAGNVVVNFLNRRNNKKQANVSLHITPYVTPNVNGATLTFNF